MLITFLFIEKDFKEDPDISQKNDD